LANNSHLREHSRQTPQITPSTIRHMTDIRESKMSDYQANDKWKAQALAITIEPPDRHIKRK